MFKTRIDLPSNKKFKQHQLNVSIDSEISKLVAEYEETSRQVETGIESFRNNFRRYQEPESQRVLKEKSDIEVQYLQKTIIMMELK